MCFRHYEETEMRRLDTMGNALPGFRDLEHLKWRYTRCKNNGGLRSGPRGRRSETGNRALRAGENYLGKDRRTQPTTARTLPSRLRPLDRRSDIVPNRNA